MRFPFIECGIDREWPSRFNHDDPRSVDLESGRPKNSAFSTLDIDFEEINRFSIGMYLQQLVKGHHGHFDFGRYGKPMLVRGSCGSIHDGRETGLTDHLEFRCSRGLTDRTIQDDVARALTREQF